jgi:hypothetical protein
MQTQINQSLNWPIMAIDTRMWLKKYRVQLKGMFPGESAH